SNLRSAASNWSRESALGYRYVSDLFSMAPNVFRSAKEKRWQSYTGKSLVREGLHHISGVAFRYEGQAKLTEALNATGTDVALGIEFFGGEERVLLHIATRRRGFPSSDLVWLEKTLVKLAE